MRLRIKQKKWSMGNRFIVTDEGENNRYYTLGKAPSWGRKITVYDIAGNKTAFIRQERSGMRFRYFIEIGDVVYPIKKELKRKHSRFSIENAGWQIKCDFMSSKFEIREQNAIVMRISKLKSFWAVSYELDIQEAKNEILCLCVGLVIAVIQADELAIIIAAGS